MSNISAQGYPRVEDEGNRFNGYLDESRLAPHVHKISREELKNIILASIDYASGKSSRQILNVPEGATEDQANRIYSREGRKLFTYFRNYYDDPASAAYQYIGKRYSEVASEQFRNRVLQKQRMNSGWRYQYIAEEAARQSKRFISISGIGTAEADFNAQISQADPSRRPVNIYVSVKNRSNTLGGQDWPKAIQALEQVARSDRNRDGPYICVFGIAMERGQRRIKVIGRTNSPHSFNTEVWLSDFFWPFFANYSYEEIISEVLYTLMEVGPPDPAIASISLPDKLLESFEQRCREYHLLDSEGHFNDADKLVQLFCGTASK